MASHPPSLPNDARLRAMAVLVSAYTELTTAVEADLERSAVKGSEFEVLVRLAASPGQRLQMSVLAQHSIVSVSGLTRLVDRLEAAGLVDRVKDPEDRRISYARLTAAGRAEVDQALPGHLALLDETLTGPLEPDELEAFVATLRKIRAATRARLAHADGRRAPVTDGQRPPR